MRAITSNMIRGYRIRILDRDLHVIEAGFGERSERAWLQAHGGCDEIAVASGVVGSGRNRQEIAPGGGFPAGQMHLQNPEVRRLQEDPRPGRRVEFVCPQIELKRVRAIGTAKRTTVREFGEKAQRMVKGRASHERYCSDRKAFLP